MADVLPAGVPSNPHARRWLAELHRLQALRAGDGGDATGGGRVFLWDIRVRILVFLLHTHPDDPWCGRDVAECGGGEASPFVRLMEPAGLEPRRGREFRGLLEEIAAANETIRLTRPRLPPY